MKQIIGTDFEEYYYLLEDGRIYNAKTKHYLEEQQRSFILKKKDGSRARISLKRLYRLVYNKEFCIDKIENLQDEVWKEIKETDGVYYISNRGRIKSYHGYNAIILKPYTCNNSSYATVDIIVNGQRCSAKVHRFVAFYFLEVPKEPSFYEVHHKDFNRFNNDANNLEWLTISEHHKKHSERKKKKNANSTKPKDNSSK